MPKTLKDKLYETQLNDFKQQSRHFLLTSRFNNKTWQENQIFRKGHPKLGCIYCAPDPIAHTIPIEAVLFILEMNNDTNQIMGIGMVRNRPIFNKYYVYENDNYNRYVYAGKTRIDREEMTEEEDRIMQVFDILCFNGNRHMKRGQGIKSFPTDMLFKCSKRLDLVQFISTMFKTRLSNMKQPKLE